MEFKNPLEKIFEKSSVVKKLKTDRTACVGILIRPKDKNGHDKVESFKDCSIFFILRADNEKDRWSGHVGFPGGMQDKDETDIETCEREIFEETGIKVNSSFECLGAINDVVVNSFVTKRLIVRSFVYLEKKNSREYQKDIRLQESEIKACGWCDVNDLINRSYLSLKRIPISSFLSKELSLSSKICELLGIKEIYFTEIELNIKDLVTVSNTKDMSLAFHLWGLTLTRVDELLYRQTKAINKTLYAEYTVDLFAARFNFVKRVPNAFVKNMLFSLSNKVAKTVYHRNPTLSETISLLPHVLAILTVVFVLAGKKLANL